MNEADANLFTSDSSGETMHDRKTAEDLFGNGTAPIPGVPELLTEHDEIDAQCRPVLITRLIAGNAALRAELAQRASYAPPQQVKAMREELEAAWNERDALRSELEKEKAAHLAECDRQDKQFWEIDRLTKERDALRAEVERLRHRMSDPSVLDYDSGAWGGALAAARAEVEALKNAIPPLVAENEKLQAEVEDWRRAADASSRLAGTEASAALAEQDTVAELQAEVERLKAEVAKYQAWQEIDDPTQPFTIPELYAEMKDMLRSILADAERDQERLNIEAEKRAAATMARLYPPRKSIGAIIVERLHRFAESLRKKQA